MSMISTSSFALSKELSDQYYSAGYWTRDDFWESFAQIVVKQPQAIAFVEGSREISFVALAEMARKFAGAVIKSGVNPGDVVIIHGRHCIEAVVAILGCAYSGAVAALLPHMFSDEQISGIVRSTGAKVIVALGETSEIERSRAAAMAAGVGLLVTSDEVSQVALNPVGTGEHGWSAFLNLYPDDVPQRQPMDADALLLLIYSSGTTGAPKGVMHSSNTVRFSIHAYAEMQSIDAGDVELVVTAFGFVGSSILGFYLSLILGCKTILLRHWDAEPALKLIAEHRVTHFLLMPTHGLDILNLPLLKEADCSSIKCGVVAGLSKDHRLQARQYLSDKAFPMYGMSESPAHITGAMADAWEDLLLTEGSAIPGAEVLICNDDDQPVPEGTPGNILVRGPNRFLGYYQADEQNRSALTDQGYFRTGDIGVVNQKGYMTFVSRSKDIIRRGGVTITPADIEAELRPHPRVKDVAVVGLPDDRLGERACACLITKDGEELTLAEITQFLTERGFPRYLWPESVETCAEFPRTPSLKVQKNRLREDILRRHQL